MQKKKRTKKYDASLLEWKNIKVMQRIPAFKVCLHNGVFNLLLASMSLSRGAVSEDESCSLTFAMSLGCK